MFTAANMNKFLIVVLFNEFEFCLKVDYWIVKLIAEVQMPLKLNVFCQVFDCSKHSACD